MILNVKIFLLNLEYNVPPTIPAKYERVPAKYDPISPVSNLNVDTKFDGIIHELSVQTLSLILVICIYRIPYNNPIGDYFSNLPSG